MLKMEAVKNKKWHQIKPTEIFDSLKTSLEGLAQNEAEERITEFGSNELTAKESESLFAIFLRQFQSPLIYILVFAATVSAAMRKLDSALVITFVLVTNAVMGFIQESRAKRTMESLRELSSPKTKVFRGGKLIEISSQELVPGDVIYLESGAKVPTDARVVESIRLKLNEASLTGESVPVDKITEVVKFDFTLADRINMVYAGTIVVEGRGKAVVTETGMNTEIGKIADIIQAAPEVKTPFQKKMESFGKFVIILVSAQVAIAFIIGYFFREMSFYDIFLVAISQMVSSIPEGLPVAVTVALAVGMRRMAKKKALIRKLPAVEGLGSATYICSDKTGTLTKNEMTSKRAMTLNCDISISGTGYTPEGDYIVGDKKITNPLENNEIEMLLKTAVLCNNAKIEDNSGDPTELAYIVAAQKAGILQDALNAKYPRTDELPFESHIQMMLTKHETPEGKILICVKGALEKILDVSGFCSNNGKIEPLTQERKITTLQKSELLASDALRILGFGYLLLEKSEDIKLEIELVKNKVIFSGLIGNIDPPREEVKEAIKLCQSAGIKITMITGDHLSTAKAIARQLGILAQEDNGTTGDILNVMNQEELEGAVKKFNVFARIEPRNKYQIVSALQRSGEVVAMTGDGVNDAPALAAADIGVAMGITGTDVAKESSSMVIVDDNFATIVNAVEEGRGITANMRKTILFLLCSSNAQILVLLTALISGLPLPLLAVQILWINLVSDGALTVNLIMEPKEDVMHKPPDRKNEPIATKEMLKILAFRVPIMAGGIIGLFAWEISRGVELNYARTVAFMTLAVTQWLNGISSRSNTKSIFQMSLLANKYLAVGLLIAVGLSMLILYVPFLQRLFETVPLSGGDWLRILLVASIPLWAEEIRKIFQRRKSQKGQPSVIWQ